MEEPTDASSVAEVLRQVNLDTLPVTVLAVMMASLSYEDVKRLCSTVKGLAARCKKYDLIELKAREEVAREAPLSQLVASYKNHVKLIERGYKTVYNFDMDVDEEATFGLGDLDVAGQIEFEIVGLPPPKGTRVWVMYFIDLGVIYPSVFNSLEELKADARRALEEGFRGGHAIDEFVREAGDGYDSEIDEMVMSTKQREAYYGFYLKQITLP